MPRGPGCFLGIGVGPVGFEFHAASLSSLSAPRMTILSASSGSGRCNAFASSHAARIHTSRSSSVVRITGMALGWIGLDHSIRRSGQEAVNEVRSRDRFRLSATVAFELGPDAAEGERRSVIIQRKPHHVLVGLGFGIPSVQISTFLSRGDLATLGAPKNTNRLARACI